MAAAVARAAGTPLPQQAVQVLSAVAASEAARPVAEVARVASMDMGAVSRQLKLLESHGLVRRAASPDHGSVVLVDATPEGRDAARKLDRVRSRHLADALADWTPQERAELGRLLVRLVDDLHATELKAVERATGRPRVRHPA